MSEKDRIEKVMQIEGMNSAVFASAIGIQGSTLSHILNGRNNPSLAVLQSILNRFPHISPEWLIMGQGTMERIVKQSQMPSLFAQEDESNSKSVTSEPIHDEKNGSIFSVNQQKTVNITEIPIQTQQTPLQEPEQRPVQIQQVELPGKTVRKIIVYYTDNTFQEFQ